MLVCEKMESYEFFFVITEEDTGDRDWDCVRLDVYKRKGGERERERERESGREREREGGERARERGREKEKKRRE